MKNSGVRSRASLNEGGDLVIQNCGEYERRVVVKAPAVDAPARAHLDFIALRNIDGQWMEYVGTVVDRYLELYPA